MNFPCRRKPSNPDTFPTESIILDVENKPTCIIPEEIRIRPFELKKICFTELMTIKPRSIRTSDMSIDESVIQSTPIDIGIMCLSIKEIKSDQMKITANLQIRDAQNRMEASNTHSIINRNLQMIEEKCNERLHFSDGRADENFWKSLTIKPYFSGIRSVSLETEQTCHGKKYKTRKLHSVQKGVDFITNGADVLLKRFWAISGFCGSIQAQSVDIMGCMHIVNYVCNPVRRLRWNEQLFDVIEIAKIVNTIDENSDVSKWFLLSNGQMFRCEFKLNGNWYVGQMSAIPLDEVAALFDNDDDGKQLTKYLDYKKDRFDEFNTLIENSLDIKNLINDYVLCLILTKPKDVLEFSKDYFEKFL